MTESQASSAELAKWLLERLMKEAPAIVSCGLMSADGLPIQLVGEPHHIAKDELAAIAAGFASLARSSGKQLTGDTTYRQVTVAYGEILLIVQVAGEGAVQTAVTKIDADPDAIGYAMEKLRDGVPEVMKARARESLAVGDPAGP